MEEDTESSCNTSESFSLIHRSSFACRSMTDLLPKTKTLICRKEFSISSSPHVGVTDFSSETDSDAGTSDIVISAGISDGEGDWEDETVQKKLEFLAFMVGIEYRDPVDVLTEVVRVLKKMKRESRTILPHLESVFQESSTRMDIA